MELESQKTSYDVFSYLVSLIICFFLCFSPNKILAIFLIIIIQLLMIYETFKYAIINIEQIIYVDLLKKVEIEWDEIKEIQLKGGVKANFHLVFILKNRKKYKLYVNLENRHFVYNICELKKIKYKVLTSINVNW